MRKRVEELFGEAKEFMGLRQMKFRGALYVQEQVLLTATAQNIKRMARLLSRPRPGREACALATISNIVSEGFCHFVLWIRRLMQAQGDLAFQPV